MNRTSEIRRQIFQGLQSAFCEMPSGEFTEFCQELKITIENYPKQKLNKLPVSGSSPSDEEMMRLFESITDEELEKAVQKYKGLRSASNTVAQNVSVDKCNCRYPKYNGYTCSNCDKPY